MTSEAGKETWRKRSLKQPCGTWGTGLLCLLEKDAGPYWNPGKMKASKFFLKGIFRRDCQPKEKKDQIVFRLGEGWWRRGC